MVGQLNVSWEELLHRLGSCPCPCPFPVPVLCAHSTQISQSHHQRRDLSLELLLGLTGETCPPNTQSHEQHNTH